MDKTCDSCYWKDYRDMHCLFEPNAPIENTCVKHEGKCVECDDASSYLYKDAPYCTECLLKEFGVEESSVTSYSLDGEYLGDENDMDEVMTNIDPGIVSI